MTARLTKQERLQVTCPGCGAAFTFLPTDCRRVTVELFFGLFTDDRRVVDCPHCRLAVILASPDAAGAP